MEQEQKQVTTGDVLRKLYAQTGEKGDFLVYRSEIEKLQSRMGALLASCREAAKAVAAAKAAEKPAAPAEPPARKPAPRGEQPKTRILRTDTVQQPAAKPAGSCRGGSRAEAGKTRRADICQRYGRSQSAQGRSEKEACASGGQTSVQSGRQSSRKTRAVRMPASQPSSGAVKPRKRGRKRKTVPSLLKRKRR